MARTWSDRWNRIKAKVTLTDLALDMSGKILAALGVGALLAQALQPHAWWLILGGIALSAAVKAKYWKSFWS